MNQCETCCADVAHDGATQCNNCWEVDRRPISPRLLLKMFLEFASPEEVRSTDDLKDDQCEAVLLMISPAAIHAILTFETRNKLNELIAVIQADDEEDDTADDWKKK